MFSEFLRNQSWAKSIVQSVQDSAAEEMVADSTLSIRYEDLIKMSGEIFYTWNSQTNHVIYTGGVQKTLGCGGSDLGASLFQWIERIHPEDQRRYLENLNARMQEPSEFTLDFRVRHQQGH